MNMSAGPTLHPKTQGRILPASSSSLWLQAFLGLWERHSSLCLHLRMDFSSTSVSLVPFCLLWKTWSLDLGPIRVIQDELILRSYLITSAKPLFPGREHIFWVGPPFTPLQEPWRIFKQGEWSHLVCFKKTALVLWENGCDEESSRDTVGEAIAVIETRCDGMEMKKNGWISVLHHKGTNGTYRWIRSREEGKEKNLGWWYPSLGRLV